MNRVDIGEIMIIYSNDLTDILYSKDKNLMRSRWSRQSSKGWLSVETIFFNIVHLDSRLQTAGAKYSNIKNAFKYELLQVNQFSCHILKVLWYSWATETQGGLWPGLLEPEDHQLFWQLKLQLWHTIDLCKSCCALVPVSYCKAPNSCVTDVQIWSNSPGIWGEPRL